MRKNKKDLSQEDHNIEYAESKLSWVKESDNRWGIRLLDVRPVTQHMLSTSSDIRCAMNAVSFECDDGTSFIGENPQLDRFVAVNLRFPIDKFLADGILFTPRTMEHQWAIFYHQNKIIFVKSWQRRVTALAHIENHKDHVIIALVHGAFVEENEPPDLTIRVLDYLLVSHALKEDYPAPIPLGMENDPQAAAWWCMSKYGNLAKYATPFQFERRDPEVPLRTDSLLHIAVAQGDTVAIRRHLASGVPIDILSNDGDATLHWALACEDPSIITLLLDLGANVDIRSSKGATPLMIAAQDAYTEQLTLLLSHGANINAQDLKGFTALHRAAERGNEDIVKILLDHRASPSSAANGCTPRSLAELGGHSGVVDLLKRCPDAL
jgi:hypothetical protein